MSKSTRPAKPNSKLNVLMGKLTENEISYKELAKAMGYSYDGMVKILNGESKCYLSLQLKILDYLNKKGNKEYTLNDLFM